VTNSENTEEQEINCELENPDHEALNILMLVKYLSINTVNIQKKSMGTTRTISWAELCGNT
jgi:hypothetical protein